MSAATGEGIDEFIAKIDEASIEYERLVSFFFVCMFALLWTELDLLWS